MRSYDEEQTWDISKRAQNERRFSTNSEYYIFPSNVLLAELRSIDSLFSFGQGLVSTVVDKTTLFTRGKNTS